MDVVSASHYPVGRAGATLAKELKLNWPRNNKKEGTKYPPAKPDNIIEYFSKSTDKERRMLSNFWTDENFPIRVPDPFDGELIHPKKAHGKHPLPGAKFTVTTYDYPTVEHSYHAVKSDRPEWKYQFTTQAREDDKAVAEGKKVSSVLRAYAFSSTGHSDQYFVGGQGYKALYASKSLHNFQCNYGQREFKFSRYDKMLKLCRIKFTQNPVMKELLLSTNGYELRHTGPKIDTKYWGCEYTKYSSKHPECEVGPNVQGEILMKVRGELGGTGVVEAGFTDKQLPPVLALRKYLDQLRQEQSKLRDLAMKNALGKSGQNPRRRARDAELVAWASSPTSTPSSKRARTAAKSSHRSSCFVM